MVKVASIQFEPRLGNVQWNGETTVSKIHESADSGAKIIVMPELAACGYMFRDKEELKASSDDLSGTQRESTVMAWRSVAMKRQVLVIGGFAHRVHEEIFNASIAILPDGKFYIYHKLHLWGAEKEIFSPGENLLMPFETPYGKLAMLICYDIWFPETVRALALNGAEVLCVPTNWVPMRHMTASELGLAPMLMQTNSLVNGIYSIAADRIGTERGQDFIGQSVIVGNDGLILSGPASPNESSIMYASINPENIEKERNWSKWNNPINDRRRDILKLSID